MIFFSSSGSGEDVANDQDVPSLDSAVQAGLISPGVKPPKSPSKSGSAKKKSYATNATKATRVVQTAKRTLYTAGRPPWYNSQGQLKDAFVIGELPLSRVDRSCGLDPGAALSSFMKV